MNYNDFEQLVLSRQACRDFNDKPLEKEVVEKIAKLAKLSPSACNSQPWKMYCVTSPEKVKLVAEALMRSGRNKFLEKAKAFIAVTEKATALKPDVLKYFGLDHFVKYDIGEIIAYVTLTAKSLGVDSIVIGWLDKEKLLSAIEAKEGEDCTLVVALGYSDSPLRQKDRKADEEVIKII